MCGPFAAFLGTSGEAEDLDAIFVSVKYFDSLTRTVMQERLKQETTVPENKGKEVVDEKKVTSA